MNNYHIRINSIKKVRRRLYKLIRQHAYISPADNGWITVCDGNADSDETPEMHRISRYLSARLTALVCAIFTPDKESGPPVCLLYHKGTLLSQTVFIADNTGTNAELLKSIASILSQHHITAMNDASLSELIEEYAHTPSGILHALSCITGINETHITTGFDAIKANEAQAKEYSFVQGNHYSYAVKPFLLAIARGSKDSVSNYLNKNFSANAMVFCCRHELPRGYSALMVASEYEHVEIVRMLIESGAHIHTEDRLGENALFKAVHKGHKDVVSLLISEGLSVNACNNCKETPLIIAAAKGFSEIIQILLDAGARVNYQDSQGFSALITAAASDTGINVEAGGLYSLIWPANEEYNPASIKLLLNAEQILN